MKIKVAKYTDIGSRPRNEDYALTGEAMGHWIFALADGLGGHGLGDEASKSVCETAVRHLVTLGSMGNEMFREVVDLCQERLLAKQQQLHAEGQMRTTLNLLCLDSGFAYWAHIGDSRTYYFKDKSLVRRTVDHSVSQMLVTVGELEENKIRFHEDRNRLLRVLGVEDTKPAADVEEPVPLTGGQQFLMCSDGFWELINEEQMLLCLDESGNPQLWLDNMLELVKMNGRGKSLDNCTAIAVWIYE